MRKRTIYKKPDKNHNKAFSRRISVLVIYSSLIQASHMLILQGISFKIGHLTQQGKCKKFSLLCLDVRLIFLDRFSYSILCYWHQRFCDQRHAYLGRQFLLRVSRPRRLGLAILVPPKLQKCLSFRFNYIYSHWIAFINKLFKSL